MTEKKLVREVLEAADEWEAKGWLHKFQDESGLVWWELTPLGRKALGLPPDFRQSQ